MKQNFSRKTELLLDAIYPKQCVCCNEIIDSDEELCDNCLRNIERVNDATRCLKCGLEKQECQCPIYVYHFEGVLAPFYNKGIAKTGMYALKFKRREQYAVFFAREMAKTVKSQLSDREFDAVCYIPSSNLSFLKRGFNQSYIIAKQIANFLEIPLIKDALKCNFTLNFQHRLGRIKRFEKVQKKYIFTKGVSKQITDKRILLVDDIKTTGATLDECSRQLLLSGAESVFCITALVTVLDKTEKKKK